MYTQQVGYPAEVAYGDMAPYMENAAVVGPTHSPVLDAMTTMEERERIEADYEWFRYSKFALAFLVFILLVATTLLCLTLWFGGVSVKTIRPGVPRQMLHPVGTDADENGVPKYNRNIRIAAFVLGFFGLFGISLTMYLKPAPSIRKGAYMGFAFLGLFLCGVLSAIAGAMDAGNVQDATWCRSRERGTVLEGFPSCYSMEKMMVAITVVDILQAVLAILTAVLLIMAAAKSFAAPKSPEEEFNEAPSRGVSKTTREILLILMFALFVTLTLQCAFTIILHEGRDMRFADEVFYVRTGNNDKSGWPVVNTRMRIAGSSIVILTVLVNLIPFRSRVFAYLCAFIYFCCSVILLVSFGMDTKEVDSARSMQCPHGWDCFFHPYVTTCFFDIFLAFLLVVYIIVEFIGRLLMECRHCTRAYGVFEIKKHEGSECSSRPVTCEVCLKGTSAKEFTYKHRFECGHDSRRCEQCTTMVPEWGMKKHQDECTKWPVVCGMCDSAFAREDLPAHTATCPMIPAVCEACGETFRTRDMSDHSATCSEMTVSCQECSKNMPRYRLPSHKGECKGSR